jgi:hypothetical protein
MGWDNPLLPQRCFGYVYWPAMIGIILSSTWFAKFGALLAHRLPPRKLKKLLAVMLLFVAIKLFL